MIEVRAGLPPRPAELLTRYARIGWLDQLHDDLFTRWEEWFIDVEASHTSQPSLVFSRSPHPERSWITAAGCVLDVAASTASTIDRPHDSRADIMMRTGWFCLNRICNYFRRPYDSDPDADTPITVSRREYDLLCVGLRAIGIPLKTDLDQAWRDYRGWRVNYDKALVNLCSMVVAPPAKWSSDRVRGPRRAPTVWRRRTLP